MAALGNQTQRILQLESGMGVVECRSTLCRQLFKQGPSMRGCSCYGGSRGCWGGPRAPLSLIPSIPVDVHPPGASFLNSRRLVLRACVEGGEDRNTDSDRSRAFWYVILTPSESRRPACLASRLTAWARPIYAQGLGAVLCKQVPSWAEQCRARQLA